MAEEEGLALSDSVRELAGLGPWLGVRVREAHALAVAVVDWLLDAELVPHWLAVKEEETEGLTDAEGDAEQLALGLAVGMHVERSKAKVKSLSISIRYARQGGGATAAQKCRRAEQCGAPLHCCASDTRCYGCCSFC